MNTNQSYEDPSKYRANTEKASELLDEALAMMWCGGLDWATSDDFKDLRENNDVNKADAAYLLYRGNLVMKVKALILQSFRSVSDIREAVPEKMVYGDPVVSAAHNKDFIDGFNQTISEVLERLNIKETK